MKGTMTRAKVTPLDNEYNQPPDWCPHCQEVNSSLVGEGTIWYCETCGECRDADEWYHKEQDEEI